jgi:hypothetical protein
VKNWLNIQQLFHGRWKHYENQLGSPLLIIQGFPTIPRAWQEVFNNTKSIAKRKHCGSRDLNMTNKTNKLYLRS